MKELHLKFFFLLNFDIAIIPIMEYNIFEVSKMLAYMTANEAAEKWNISHRRVLTLCKDSRIKDVAMLGNMWIIPIDATKPEDARTVKQTDLSGKESKPFLKWAGGKGQLLKEISKYYPFADSAITKYAEPMIGGGAVLFDILNKFNLKDVYISDSNFELINSYITVRDNVEELIHILTKLQTEFIPLDEENRKEYYYEKRERFNLLKAEKKEGVELASLMIFLNRTCFNGLYRVNKKGQFNVPMGSYKNPLICDERNLREVSKKLRGINIVCGDYSKAESFIDEHTFVYIDPPYRPLSQTASFTSYTEVVFNDAQQIELAKFADKIAKKGARVLLSNSDPKNADEKDNFFDELYSNYKITRVNAARMINSDSKNRGKIKELLISNF